MTQRVKSMQPEWPFEPLEPLEPLEQPSDEGEITDRCPSDDLSALLTDLQYAALRWLASFD